MANVSSGETVVHFSINGKPVTWPTSHATVREILATADVDPATHRIIRFDEDRQILETELGEALRLHDGERFETVHVYVYLVDGELQVSVSENLTVREILSNATVDPADHYLVKLQEPEPIEYRDLDETLRLSEGEKFLTVYHGPTPVS